MSSKFHAAVQQKDDVSYVKLSGVIDEDNDLGGLVERLPGGPTIIDLAEIERINSCGVRDWVNWLGRVEKQGSRVVLVECSPAIVAQINLVNNFTGNGVVKSFYAPYFCPNCEREKVLLVETRDLAGRTAYKAPTCRCDECDGVMDFDDMEESFFAFLANEKKVAQDVQVEAALSELAPSTPGDRKLKLRSSGSGGGPAVAAQGGSPTSAGSVPSHPGAVPTPMAAGYSGSHGSGSQLPMGIRGGGTGTSPGSYPGSRTPVGGGRWPGSIAPDDPTRRMMAAAPQPRSPGAWILVGVLVAAAVALLVYVFLSSGRPA